MKIINDVKKLELPTNPNIISTKELVFFYELMKSRCLVQLLDMWDVFTLEMGTKTQKKTQSHVQICLAIKIDSSLTNRWYRKQE